jgi:hypothetical protein
MYLEGTQKYLQDFSCKLHSLTPPDGLLIKSGLTL